MEEDKTGIQVWSKVIVARKKASQWQFNFMIPMLTIVKF